MLFCNPPVYQSILDNPVFNPMFFPSLPSSIFLYNSSTTLITV
uniref:Uncharacterized protein n=1 Tax=CrAss-like virus sp. ctYsL76 TaxID=2826826 RepID=A0A8S5QMC5_9CAUD|nr:MAG TPA: hypothetical protein [CrAss-like virus sp. ctYsL76]